MCPIHFSCILKAVAKMLLFSTFLEPLLFIPFLSTLLFISCSATRHFKSCRYFFLLFLNAHVSDQYKALLKIQHFARFFCNSRFNLFVFFCECCLGQTLYIICNTIKYIIVQCSKHNLQKYINDIY